MSARLHSGRALWVMLVIAGIWGIWACRTTPGCFFSPPTTSPAAGQSPSQQHNNGSLPSGDENMLTKGSASGIAHANDANFAEAVINASGPVLVDFYADWCGPCQRLAPLVEQFARETPGVKVVKVNVDDSPSVAGQYGISSIPTLMVFKDGRVTAQTVGLVSKSHLQAMVSR